MFLKKTTVFRCRIRTILIEGGTIEAVTGHLGEQRGRNGDGRRERRREAGEEEADEEEERGRVGRT